VSKSEATNSAGDLWFDRLSTPGVFGILALVTLLLRVFYSSHLFQDEGLWFTAADQIARGKTLYRDIYFDKPPLLPLVLAALFKVCGDHIICVRLFEIAYSIAIAAALYLLARSLYTRREATLAAAMFSVFSTTFTTGHMQGLSTDFLMVLPSTGAALLMIRSTANSKLARTARMWHALLAGLLTGVGIQVNPKSSFNLLLFAGLLVMSSRWRTPEDSQRVSGWALMALAIAGASMATAPFLWWLATTDALKAYVEYVWEWGGRYALYYSPWFSARSGLTQTFYYLAVNPLLTAGALGFCTAAFANRRKALDSSGNGPTRTADGAIGLWLIVSYLAMATGGRFFGHYFYALLPALCVASSRGLNLLLQSGWEPLKRRRRALAAILFAFLAFTIVRFHTRTAVLAFDLIRGRKSFYTKDWLHDRLNEEEKTVAREILSANDSSEARDRSVFVWGYRPEIYYWSRSIPASRFLSSQPLTGVPADVHYFGDDYRPLLNDEETSEFRRQLADDLTLNKPIYIVDELGFFNTSLGMETYGEFQDTLGQYKKTGTLGRFILYVRNETRPRYRERHGLTRVFSTRPEFRPDQPGPPSDMHAPPLAR
jgi:4-amino-4-deoxy-L-arabinose transferase-like glycosyltransferase